MGSGLSGKYANTYGSSSESEYVNSAHESDSLYNNKKHILRKSTGQSNINDNVESMKKDYPFDKNGLFGEKGRTERLIRCEDPVSTSKDFYSRIGDGGEVRRIPGKEGTITRLDDGAEITHRIVTKTKNSPAVDINIKNVENSIIKGQKIHFEGK